jgi:hypothetical protein
MTTMTDENGAAPSGPPSEPRLRASDDDRLATVRVLQDAVGRGLLTPDECSDRMAAAFAAVHREELGPLTADLPAVADDITAPGWATLGLLAVEQLRSSLCRPATDRLHPTRVAVALAVALLLVVAVASVAVDVLFDGGGRFGDD